MARAVKIEMQRETETKREKGQATKIAADQCVLLMDKRGKSTKCGTPEFSQKQFILFLFIVDLYMCNVCIYAMHVWLIFIKIKNKYINKKKKKIYISYLFLMVEFARVVGHL